jgi:hypothetical protein
MAHPSADEVRLQLAMAFGQGAGYMLATPAALDVAVSSQAKVMERAMRNWAVTRYALTELVRLAGQIAAARAAVEGRTEIDRDHARYAIDAVLEVCPCLARYEDQ